MNWKTWLKSLGAAAIGGAATAGSSWAGFAVAQSVGVKVQSLDLKSLGIILLSGAITSALAYLKQSPLPGTGVPDIAAAPPK